MTQPFEHENTPYGAFGEFEPHDDVDWAEHDAEATVFFAGEEGEPVYDEPYYFDAVDQGYYDDDPNPYHGDYSEM